MFLSSCEQYELDLTNPEDQKKLAKSFVDNFNQVRPIDPIAADDITEAREEWLELLNNFKFTMTNEERKLLAQGEIRNAYEPLYRVRHLRNQMIKRGRPLKAGNILSLGNMSAIRPLKPIPFFDPAIRPLFKGNIATVSYIGLDPSEPATVSVIIDR